MTTARETTDARGFSLIEFMVAMLLGTILIGGAVSVYLASKRSYVEVEQVGGLSENARFALQLFGDSLRHIGFYGSIRPGDIDKDTNLGTVSGDCSPQADAYNLNSYMFAVSTDALSDPGTALGCIADAIKDSDVLVVKYLVPNPISDEDPDDPNAILDGVLDFPSPLLATENYVIANTEFGVLMDGADTAPDVRDGKQFARAVAWPYRFQIYYVRGVTVGSEVVPTLARKTLGWNGSAMAVLTEDLVQGVEKFYLRFGIANPATGEVESYTSDLSTVPWDRVASIETFILVRSTDRDPVYVDSKTYNLGDIAITPATNVNYPVNYRRLMMHSSISLRNPKLIIRGGA